MSPYRRTPKIAWRKIGEETVVLHLEQRVALGLNRAAGLLLGLLESPRSPAFLASIFGEERAREGWRLAGFLEELAAHGLIERVEDDAVEPATTEIEGNAYEGEPPRVLWQETLETLAFQVSPPMMLGDPECAV